MPEDKAVLGVLTAASESCRSAQSVSHKCGSVPTTHPLKHDRTEQLGNKKPGFFTFGSTVWHRHQGTEAHGSYRPLLHYTPFWLADLSRSATIWATNCNSRATNWNSVQATPTVSSDWRYIMNGILQITPAIHLFYTIQRSIIRKHKV